MPLMRQMMFSLLLGTAVAAAAQAQDTQPGPILEPGQGVVTDQTQDPAVLAPPPPEQPAVPDTPAAAKPKDDAPSPEQLGKGNQAPVQATVPMQVEIVDATTMKDTYTGKLYRLYGVEACRQGQIATTGGKQPWDCHLMARAFLIQATLTQYVICVPVREEPKATVARCATAKFPDMARGLLSAGLAVQSPKPEDRYIIDYQQAQNEARTKVQGLWTSSFDWPWEFESSTQN